MKRGPLGTTQVCLPPDPDGVEEGELWSDAGALAPAAASLIDSWALGG